MRLARGGTCGRISRWRLVAMEINISPPGSARGPHASSRIAGGRGFWPADPATQPAATQTAPAVAAVSNGSQPERRALPTTTSGVTSAGTSAAWRTKAGTYRHPHHQPIHHHLRPFAFGNRKQPTPNTHLR